MEINSLILASSIASNILLFSGFRKQTTQNVKRLSSIACDINNLSKMVALDTENEAYLEQLELSTLLFNQSADSILIADANGIISEANPAFYSHTGYTREDVLGKSLGFCFNVISSVNSFGDYVEKARNEGVVTVEIFTERNDLSTFPELATISIVKKGDEVENIVVFSRDISEQKAREGQLLREVKRDKLTGIFNRDGFESRLFAAIQTADESGGESCVGLLFLDLDEFKPINDNYGHDVGDQILITVANRIEALCSEVDTVARLGGDEFVCVFPFCGSREELEEKGENIIRALEEFISGPDYSVRVGCSIGGAMYPSDAKSVATLIKASDVAMYQAKTAGKNQIRLYDPTFKSKEQQYEEMAEKIFSAARKNKFNIVLHPVFNSSGDVYSYDVMLRWNVNGEPVAPDLFIEVAEKHGLMNELYDYTLRTLAFNVDVKKEISAGRLFSIKLEKSAIQSADFSSKFAAKLDNLGLPKKNIIVRVDEQVVAAAMTESTANISYFEQQGINVCLDDFCAGNFSILERLSLHSTLAKLPRELVNQVEESNNKLHILNSIFALATGMNTVVMVEGVNSKKAMDLFFEHGVQFVQGNYLSKPFALSELCNFNHTIQNK